MLSFGWPRNYRQIKEVVQAAVSASADEPITLEVLNEAIGVPLESVAPTSRISTLMKAEQRRYLKRQMERDGLTAAELAKKLDLDSSVQTKDDLNNLPLLRSELSSF